MRVRNKLENELTHIKYNILYMNILYDDFLVGKSNIINHMYQNRNPNHKLIHCQNPNHYCYTNIE